MTYYVSKEFVPRHLEKFLEKVKSLDIPVIVQYRPNSKSPGIYSVFIEVLNAVSNGDEIDFWSIGTGNDAEPAFSIPYAGEYSDFGKLVRIYGLPQVVKLNSSASFEVSQSGSMLIHDEDLIEFWKSLI